MNNKLNKNHFTACILGGAIGDALGAPIEFHSIESIINKYGIQGVTDYVEHPNNVGEFTDDTQMTLFTAEGLLRAAHRAILKGIGGNPAGFVYQSYLRWLKTQNRENQNVNTSLTEREIDSGWLIKKNELFSLRAPGNTCLSALMEGKPGTIAEPINNSKGCGGVMRAAPIGLIFTNQIEKSFKIGCETAALTHGHPSGYLSAGFFASIISQLSVGTPLEKSIEVSIDQLKKLDNHQETLSAVEKAMELYRSISKVDIEDTYRLSKQIETLGGGWVGEEALAISLFCSLLFKNDFAKGVLASVNHSGDCDSTGSITGNILGLINGMESIPQRWISNLKYADIVIETAEDLHTFCKSSTFNCDEDWWEKYPGY